MTVNNKAKKVKLVDTSGNNQTVAVVVVKINRDSNRKKKRQKVSNHEGK